MMTTLMLSQGVPMIVGGDELGQTHGGNNNVYCQDNEISWYAVGRRRRSTSSTGAAGSSHSAPPTRCSDVVAGSKGAGSAASRTSHGCGPTARR